MDESGRLPTASARVSERLIVLEAAQNVQLKFELVSIPCHEIELADRDSQVNSDAIQEADFSQGSVKSSLLAVIFPLLLTRAHYALKSRRLMPKSHLTAATRQVPFQQSILHLVVDIVQYQVFCDRLDGEIKKFEGALSAAGLSRKVQFRRLGQGFGGKGLVECLSPENATPDKEDHICLSGDILVRIDNRF